MLTTFTFAINAKYSTTYAYALQERNAEARLRAQKHLRWTIEGPDSSYSCLEIHICWKVESEERIEPPIHTEYLRSGGATTCKNNGGSRVDSTRWMTTQQF